MRAAEPVMTAAVDAYLSALPWNEISKVVEVGAGSGPVSRQVARHAPHASVLATEPAADFIPHCERPARGLGNLTFAAADGADLGLPDGAMDLVIQHTVLSQVVDPEPLLAEAARVLRPGGWLVAFDGDFEKGSLSGINGDPISGCAEYFKENFVTDWFLCGCLPQLVTGAGVDVKSFGLTPRVVRDGDGMRVWVKFSADMMVDRGQIGRPLADALLGEYDRRRDAGALYASQIYATLIARKAR